MSDPTRHREGRALDAFARSAIARAFWRMRGSVESAAGHSRAGSWATRITSAWQQLDRDARLRSIGTALMTAAAVHLVLQWFHQHPVSWLWMVVPGIALAQGLMLRLVSGASSSEPS